MIFGIHNLVLILKCHNNHNPNSTLIMHQRKRNEKQQKFRTKKIALF